MLNYAGRTETDMWEQLEPHLDHVEQIYFAGGEPLMMEEHYNILEELVRRKRFDVRLIYNTNFTHTELRGKIEQRIQTHEIWARLHSGFRAGCRGGFHTNDPDQISVAWV